MKGSRPLNNTEIRAVRGAFTGKFETRNRGPFYARCIHRRTDFGTAIVENRRRMAEQ